MTDHQPKIVHSSRDAHVGELYSIVYTSTATRDVPLGDLMHLLDGARMRNSEEGITGLLLYSDRSFMKYFEGPAVGLSRVYELIKAHPMHYGLIDLVREPIKSRLFAEWSMAFHLVGGLRQAAPASQEDLLVSRIAGAARPGSVACELLFKFWHDGRGAVSSALLQHGRARRSLRPSAQLDTGTDD